MNKGIKKKLILKISAQDNISTFGAKKNGLNISISRQNILTTLLL